MPPQHSMLRMYTSSTQHTQHACHLSTAHKVCMQTEAQRTEHAELSLCDSEQPCAHKVDSQDSAKVRRPRSCDANNTYKCSVHNNNSKTLRAWIN